MATLAGLHGTRRLRALLLPLAALFMISAESPGYGHGPQAPGGLEPFMAAELDSLPSAGVAKLQMPTIEVVGQIGGWLHGEPAVQGGIAYVGSGPALSLLDVSDPAQPSYVAQTPTLQGSVNSVVVSDRYAYIASSALSSSRADPGRLSVVDVSEPAAPTVVGVLGTSSAAESVAIVGNYAYVTVYDSPGARLLVVDVSNPTAPVEVGSYLPLDDQTVPSSHWLATSRSHVYLSGGPRLLIVDIADPRNPREVGSYIPPSGTTQGIAVVGNHAYVGSRGSGLRVVDVSNAADPIEVGASTLFRDARDVRVAGGRAYVLDSPNSLRIIDVSDPRDPAELGSYPMRGRFHSFTVDGTNAYVVRTSSLTIVDLSSPASPNEVGFYTTAVYSQAAKVVASYAYIAAADSDRAPELVGLRIVDLTNPSKPVEDGFFKTPILDVAVSGGWAYIATGDGVRVLDVSRPSRAEEVHVYPAPGTSKVAVAGNYLYVAAEGELQILDVSTPFAPALVGRISSPPIRDLAVAGQFVYYVTLASRDDPRGRGAEAHALRIVDVSDATSPRQAGSCCAVTSLADFRGGPKRLVVTGGYAFMVALGVGPVRSSLVAFDVTNPANPREVSHFPIELGGGGAMGVAGRYAYIPGHRGGLQILDVSDPSNITLVATVAIPAVNSIASITTEEGYLYISGGYTGFWILHTFAGRGDLPEV